MSRKGSKRSKRRGSKRRGSKSRKGRKSRCKILLQKKIRYNIEEFKKGKRMSNGQKFTSIKQCIAVAYSQVKKSNPRCKF